MKNSIYGVLLFSSFALSIATELLADADTVNLAAGFNGSSSETFDVKQTNNADGTTYNLSSAISFLNVSKLNPANTSCFANSAGDLTFTGNRRLLYFDDIISTAKGAAISTTADAKTLTISGCLRLIFHACPRAEIGNGAIYSNSSMLIESNLEGSFGYNKSSGKGGVICCEKSTTVGATSPTLTMQNNGELLFLGNLATSSGGAIYAEKMLLSTAGNTVFQSNVTKDKGGAIAIAANGEISLSADNGNLTFERNIIITNNQTIRNAIHLEDGAKFLQLRAAKNRSIYFYDPITTTGDIADRLTINAPNGANPYEGTVVFSSATSYVDSPISKLTSFSQDLTLAAGSLILEKEVSIKAKSFEQNPQSLLFMHPGTKLETVNNISIKNLHLDLKDIANAPAILTATADGAAINIRGPVVMHLNDEIFYNQEALANTLSFECLNVGAQHLDNIIIDDIPDIPTITMETHRGYQGKWTLSWEEQPEIVIGNVALQPNKKMSLVWKPSGYIPFVGGTGEFSSSLVPNSLWNLFLDTRFAQQAIETNAQSSGNNLWISSLTNSFRKGSTDNNHGFRHKSSGYIAGGKLHTPQDDIFSIGICQLFGRSKDFGSAKSKDKFFSGSLYAQHSRYLLPIARFLAGTSTYKPRFLLNIPKDFPINFDALIGYSYGRNHMTVKYSDRTRTTSSWNTYGYSAQIGSSLPFALDVSHTFFQYISPFIKLHWIYAHQVQFQEQGIKRRSFSNSNLKNLSLPIGLKIQGQSLHRLSYELTGMYIADLYRCNPESVTSLISGGLLPWTTTATNLGKQAALLQGSGNLSLTSHINIFAQGTVEFRRSSYSYNMDFGSRVHF
ncbi:MULTISPECIES: autotransporter domain-containing protein [Chlamydia]|uniref:Autotransporter domain-containing protein n=1 Tax=Chlamydia crocodili TaxID=2766982 RepID=A0ABX8CD46_9CHLA|nr:autotransporter domain-containing protein [Chlamydia crocodili]QVE48832.1 autotransporter domain-containing protein [Chlamydia crocodili]